MSNFTTLWDGFVFGLGFAFAYCLVETVGGFIAGWFIRWCLDK